jgi:hypothetical protein
LIDRYPNIRITADRLLYLAVVAMAVPLVWNHSWLAPCYAILVILVNGLQSHLERDRPAGRSASTVNPQPKP